MSESPRWCVSRKERLFQRQDGGAGYLRLTVVSFIYSPYLVAHPHYIFLTIIASGMSYRALLDP